MVAKQCSVDLIFCVPWCVVEVVVRCTVPGTTCLVLVLVAGSTGTGTTVPSGTDLFVHNLYLHLFW